MLTYLLSILSAIGIGLAVVSGAYAGHVPGQPFACEMTLEQAKAKVAAFEDNVVWSVVKGKSFDALVAHMTKSGEDLSTTTVAIVAIYSGGVYVAFTSDETCVSEDWLWHFPLPLYQSIVGVDA